MRPTAIITLTILLGGCLCLQDQKTPAEPNTPATTTLEDVVCNRPYVRVGNGCCLDMDGNGVCDTQETAATQVQMTETTLFIAETTITTTAREPSTITTTSTAKTDETSTTLIRCWGPEDCGGNKSSVKCYKDGVYLFEEFPYCKRPGSSESVCMARQKIQVLDKCGREEVCMDSICTDLYSTSCRLACRSEGFNNYYCHVNASCMAGHSHTPYGDGNCTSEAPFCCCYLSVVAPESSTTTLA